MPPRRDIAQPAKKRARLPPPLGPPAPLHRPHRGPSLREDTIVFERDELPDDDDSEVSPTAPPRSRRRAAAFQSSPTSAISPTVESLRVENGRDVSTASALRTRVPSLPPTTVARGDTMFEVDELESTDEEEADEANEVDEASDEGDEDDDDAEEERSWSPASDEPGGQAYKMFLRSVLGEGDTPEENRIPAIAELLDDDDDFDFDYLRESALVDDDPFEYRDDRGVHVSRQEVVQLFSAADAMLRPRTRRAAPAPRIVRAPPLLRAPTPPPIAPNVLTPGVPAIPGARVIAQGPLVDANALAILHDQYAMHVHLLAAVHADAALIAASASAERPLPERSVSEARGALQTTAALAHSLLEMRDASVKFWQLVAPYRDAHTRARLGAAPFAGAVSLEQSPPVVSAFDTPALRVLGRFLTDCESLDSSTTPLAIVSRLRPHLHPAITSKLAPRPVRRIASSGGAVPWSPADDELLLMTLVKHSREFGELSRDLLPHRTPESCVKRVRYLSSRRCADNPIKRFELANSATLSRGELVTVQAALANLPPGAERDPNVWKAIQRDHLPAREWSYLQKMWQARESRRRYKATYRKKARAKGSRVENHAPASGASSTSSRALAPAPSAAPAVPTLRQGSATTLAPRPILPPRAVLVPSNSHSTAGANTLPPAPSMRIAPQPQATSTVPALPPAAARWVSQ